MTTREKVLEKIYPRSQNLEKMEKIRGKLRVPRTKIVNHQVRIKNKSDNIRSISNF